MSEDLQALSRALASDDPQERENAAQQLAEIKEDIAAPYLHHALDDESEGVRMWGAYGLSLLMRKQDKDKLARISKEDDSELVRLWATFGLAAQRDAAGAKALVEFLDSEDPDLRANAADAIVSLDDPSQVRPPLEQRMRSGDPRAKAWAAGVLHAVEHPTALEKWREALHDPVSRLDAALVAPFLQSQAAARDLLRLLSELPIEELEEIADGEVPLAELLSKPLLELGLEDLVDEGQTDGSIRGELLLILLKGPPADPDVLSQIHEFAAELPPALLGKDLAAILAAQEPFEHADMLARVSTAVPDAIEPAVAAMEQGPRKALFESIKQVMTDAGDRAFDIMPLLDVLRASRYERQFADVPDLEGVPEPETEMTAPGVPTVGEGSEESDDDAFDPDSLTDADFGELGDLLGIDEEGESAADAADDDGEVEDDLTPLIERIVAGEAVSPEDRKRAKAFLDDLSMTAEEYIEQLNAEPGEDEAPPPTAMEVAQRALALGALLRRGELERKLSAGEVVRSEVTRSVQTLKKWLDEKMLLESLTPFEADLLDARTGDWTAEDRELVDGSAEALAALMWALGKLKAPSVEEPAPTAALVKALPITQDPKAFVDRATIKDHEEISRASELWESWAFRVSQEDQARAALEDPEIELGIDLEALIDELKKEGFDEKAAAAKGKGIRAAEALRFLGKKAAAKLLEDKQVARLTAGDLSFRGKAVGQLDAETLDVLRKIVNERSRALGWVTSGGSWDDLDEGFDDFGEEEG